MRCPPTRSKRGTPQDPCRGSGLLRPTPPTHVRRWGEYPLSSKGGYPLFPPVLHLSFLTFVWNSRRSAAISGQCQTGWVPPTRVDQVTPYPHAQGLGHTPLLSPPPMGVGVAPPLSVLWFVTEDSTFIASVSCVKGGGVPTPHMP